MSPDGEGDSGDPVLRWIAQQIQRSVRDLEQLDVEAIARVTGWDPERVREQIDTAGEWITSHAEDLSEGALRRLESVVDPDTLKRVSGLLDPEVLRRFTGGFSGFSGFGSSGGSGGPSGGSAAGGPSGTAPHPLDVPTPAQGLALSAIDSGRWSVAPGSHEFVTHDGSAAPPDASGLIGELRARDWIDSSGSLTQVGRNALTRWMTEPRGT
ncbi:MAG TPA: hypothetical protein VFN48_09670 [Solirubrobacteraceae bacterium]|nr:hypothetical protein [Solirubrobacteraceae bacterium]